MTKPSSGLPRSTKLPRPHADNDSPEVLGQKRVYLRENDGGTGGPTNDPLGIFSDVDTVILVVAQRVPRIGVGLQASGGKNFARMLASNERYHRDIQDACRTTILSNQSR